MRGSSSVNATSSRRPTLGEKNRHFALRFQQLFRIDLIYRQLAEHKNLLRLDPGFEGIAALLYMAYKKMQVITARMKDEDRMIWLRSEWIYASHAIDRLCLVFLGFFICGSVLFIFFSAPYLTVDVTELT